jgi:hypothetical protein
MITIAIPEDEFTAARYRRAVTDRIAELRNCGLFVTVVEDFDVAALVDIRPDGEPPTRMLVDPNQLIAPRLREARANGR